MKNEKSINVNVLEKKIANLEFRQQLLFDDDSVSRLLFEYNITEQQYREIMDLMEEYRNKIKDQEDVHHSTFEEAIYTIVPEHASDYHMCEYLVKEFMVNKRWEEVFMALYSGMPKYQNLII